MSFLLGEFSFSHTMFRSFGRMVKDMMMRDKQKWLIEIRLHLLICCLLIASLLTCCYSNCYKIFSFHVLFLSKKWFTTRVVESSVQQFCSASYDKMIAYLTIQEYNEMLFFSLPLFLNHPSRSMLRHTKFWDL